MKKVLSKIVLIVAVAMMFSGMSTVMASAKTVKVTSAGFVTSKAAAESTAKRVGTGTVNVRIPKKKSTYSGYLKFTAPATKKYNFTVSNVKGGSYSSGFFYIMTTAEYSDQSIRMTDVATKGGVSHVLWVTSRETKSSRKSKLVDRYLKSRTGSIVLQKGQTVYLYFFLAASRNPKNVNFRLKIK